MSPKPADQGSDQLSLDAEITGAIEEFLEERGSADAALRALMHDFIVLLEDSHQSVSHGYVRGPFARGARRP